jgi:dTMP kinase
MTSAHKGALVVIEGGEGSGKSRLLHALEERLVDGGHTVVVTREPGGTSLGERIREVLLARERAGDPLAELMLFEAARAQLVAEVIRPALARGAVVLCDRFAASSIAYQSAGRGLARAIVEHANEIVTGGLIPDVTLLLDVPAEVGLRRRMTDGAANHFDNETLAFHERVNECFRQLAREDAQHWRVVDATMDFPAVVTAATAFLIEIFE